MSKAMQVLKQQQQLEALLVSDHKGFEIYNSGAFPQSHHLHALRQLSQFFFPDKKDTLVGIETDQFTVVVKSTPEGHLVATKELK